MLVPGCAHVHALIGGSLHRIDEQAAVRNPLSHVRRQPNSVCNNATDQPFASSIAIDRNSKRVLKPVRA